MERRLWGRKARWAVMANSAKRPTNTKVEKTKSYIVTPPLGRTWTSCVAWLASVPSKGKAGRRGQRWEAKEAAVVKVK